MSLGISLALGLAVTTAPDGPLLQTLHATHLCEQAAAEQPLARGASEEVKRYAREVREGHRAADQAVEALAGKLGMTLASPAAEDATNGESKDLAGLQGRPLDQAFVRFAIASQARAVSDLEAARSTLADKLVKKLCEAELRTLRALEEKARKLQDRL